MKRLWLALSFGLASGFLGGAALAHSTGDEAKSVAECQKFAGTASHGLRGECLKCVQRAKAHHFHSTETGANRCQPSDAKLTK